MEHQGWAGDRVSCHAPLPGYSHTKAQTPIFFLKGAGLANLPAHPSQFHEGIIPFREVWDPWTAPRHTKPEMVSRQCIIHQSVHLIFDGHPLLRPLVHTGLQSKPHEACLLEQETDITVFNHINIQLLIVLNMKKKRKWCEWIRVEGVWRKASLKAVTFEMRFEGRSAERREGFQTKSRSKDGEGEARGCQEVTQGQCH